MNLSNLFIIAVCAVYVFALHKVDMLSLNAAYAHTDAKRNKCTKHVGVACTALSVLPTLVAGYLLAAEILPVLFP